MAVTKRVLAMMVAMVAAMPADAQERAGRLIASPEAGWAQWRGPRRDGVSDEKRLMRSWPEGGPKAMWTATGLGSGYSCPIIAAGSIFITGDVGNELYIFALDPEGRLKWKAKNGRSWKGSYPGARACVAYSDGRIYHQNAHGRVACLDADDGREVWAVETMERFEGRTTTWAIAENLLVDGSRLIVSPGGKKAMMAALDKATGQTVWASDPLIFDRTTDAENKPLPEPVREADSASYSSPILLELNGRRQIVMCSTHHVIGVDADTGKMLWQGYMPTQFKVIAMTPVLYKDCIFMTAPDRSEGGKLLRIRDHGNAVAVEEVWSTKLDTCHGGVVYANGVLFGSVYRGYKGWACVDPTDGRIIQRIDDLPMGSAIWADGQFYCLGQDGSMSLVEADATHARIVSQFTFARERRNDVWAHPVILDGKLYLRHQDRLVCYDVRAK